jgi:hypothetical protein
MFKEMDMLRVYEVIGLWCNSLELILAGEQGARSKELGAEWFEGVELILRLRG